MNSLRISKIKDHSALYIVLAVALLVVSTILPTLASAAQLEERSVTLNSAVKGATGVTYNFKFDQISGTAATAVVIQFCTNTPLIGEFCDSPDGVVTGATAGAGVTAVDSAAGSTIKISKLAATEDITITGITNPATAGTVYARILTYVDNTAATSYVVDDDSSALGSPIDTGSVAFAITDGVQVSGAVLESLMFCVSGQAFGGSNCAGSTAPVLTLGEDVGDGVIALTSTTVSTADVFTKISTNAVKGAVVSLKSTAGDNSGTPCAGLALGGTGTCNIAAAGTTGTFSEADDPLAAKFGVKIEAPSAGPDGTINLATNYHATNYRFGPDVISTYGDPIFNTNEGYANNRNVKLTFGAIAAPNTPAGKYSTNINLIATGTF